jgi:hypothetical protein
MASLQYLNVSSGPLLLAGTTQVSSGGYMWYDSNLGRMLYYSSAGVCILGY